MATCVSSILPFQRHGGLSLRRRGAGSWWLRVRRRPTRGVPGPGQTMSCPGTRGHDSGWTAGSEYGLGALYGDRLQSVRTLSGADGVVVGDGEAHEFGHFGHGGVDEFQVPGGELPVVGCVGSFEVAFGAVEQG
jgi:hypothetical protein